MNRGLLIAAWLGSILFFAIAVAPNVFAVLNDRVGGRAMAGDIVSRALAMLHYFGMACGLAFLLLGFRRLTSAANAVVLVMLLLTCVSQFVISRRMHSIRAEGALTQSEVLDPRRGEFDILHRLSTATEGVLFLLGLGAIFIESRRD